jgi:AcrR family transcriptional regulator
MPGDATAATGRLGLRERKKLMTRRALVDAAQRMFEERGYDDVTVAEIADAANISVKTMFTYFASKEDLAFADEGDLRAELARAIVGRSAEQTPLDAGLAVIIRWTAQDDGTAAALQGYRRGYGESIALQNRLRRMWSDFEDTLTEAISASRPAGERGRADLVTARLQAMHLVLVVRHLSTPEVAAAVTTAEDPAGALRRCLEHAVQASSGAFDAG